MTVEASPMGATRERSCPCAVCRQPTMNHSGYCNAHLRAKCESCHRPNDGPGRVCRRCATFDELGDKL